MKGTVFNGFESYVEHYYGLHTWYYIIENSSLTSNGVFLASNTYEDDDLFALILTLSSTVNVSGNDIQKDFGSFFFSSLYSMIKQHVMQIDNLFEFLRAVDDVIHVEVQKADPSAYTPAFYYDSPDKKTLVMRYVSKRGMCYFAEGLIVGAAEYFHADAKISQSKCMHNGDNFCLINITV